ncbi:MAG: hypothetical protein HFF36_04120 [Coprobacillus sp.]|nr:hypothetical protein [Coprobacillus sp.]
MSSKNYLNQYIEYSPLHDKNYILELLSLEKVYSNQRNYEKKAKILLNYESQRKKGSNSIQDIIYAISLRAMLPKHLPISIKHDIVRNFMLNIHPKMKDLLYLYHFIKIGRGEYVDIIVFERQIYKKINYVDKRYIRDMFMDKITGRTCSRHHPNAIHRCRKGELQLDENGNTIKIARFISPKKYRYLNYKDNKDDEIRKLNFNNLIDKLKRCMVQAISKLSLSNCLYYSLKRERFDIKDKNKRLKAYMFNNTINYINLRLRELQNTFYYRGLYWDRNESWRHFERVFFSLKSIMDNGVVKLEKNKFRIDINFKSSFADLKTALNIFEKIADKKIKEFYYTEFYDSEFDNYIL